MAGAAGGAEAVFLRDFDLRLHALLTNDKRQITLLTVLAGDHRQHAHGIVGAVLRHVQAVSDHQVHATEASSRPGRSVTHPPSRPPKHPTTTTTHNHNTQCPPHMKLPGLYVLDSIVKNVGQPYAQMFAPHVADAFASAWAVAPPPPAPGGQGSLQRLAGTWPSYFPPEVLDRVRAVMAQAPQPAYGYHDMYQHGGAAMMAAPPPPAPYGAAAAAPPPAVDYGYGAYAGYGYGAAPPPPQPQVGYGVYGYGYAAPPAPAPVAAAVPVAAGVPPPPMPPPAAAAAAAAAMPADPRHATPPVGGSAGGVVVGGGDINTLLASLAQSGLLKQQQQQAAAAAASAGGGGAIGVSAAASSAVRSVLEFTPAFIRVSC
jgi:hypothetical protein